MTCPRKVLAKNLAERIHALKLSKSALSVKAKLSRPSIDAILNAEVSSGIDVIETLAQALETSVGWLLTDHDQPGEDDKTLTLGLRTVLDVTGLDEREMVKLSKMVTDLRRRKLVTLK